MLRKELHSFKAGIIKVKRKSTRSTKVAYQIDKNSSIRFWSREMKRAFFSFRFVHSFMLRNILNREESGLRTV